MDGWPYLKEKVLIMWSSIYNTKQSSIFILKFKNKIFVYLGVPINVCFLFREKTDILVTGNPNLRLSSLVRNKDLLLSGRGDGRGCAGRVGCLGLIFPHYHFRASLCPACPSGRLTLVG